MSYCVDSLGICVDDMDRAVQFYEQFFEQKVTEKGSIASCFEIDGFRFNLFAYNEVKEKKFVSPLCRLVKFGLLSLLILSEIILKYMPGSDEV